MILGAFKTIGCLQDLKKFYFHLAALLGEHILSHWYLFTEQHLLLKVTSVCEI